MSTPAVSPAERYAKFRERQAAPEFTSFRELYDFDFDPFQVAACAALTEGDGVLVAAPTGIWQDRRGRVRRPPRADAAQEVLLHHADQGAVQPEVQRPGKALRHRHGRPAHRRQRHQRRRPRRRDDHRGPAEHALRGLARPQGPRLRGTRRGALPRRPVTGRRLGRGDHPPPGKRPRRRPVRDGEQRGRVRRLARPGTRRHRGHRRRAPPGAAVAAHARRPEAVRPVHRRQPPRGQPGTGPAGAP